jgi:hypothetical protein
MGSPAERQAVVPRRPRPVRPFRRRGHVRWCARATTEGRSGRVPANTASRRSHRSDLPATLASRPSSVAVAARLLEQHLAERVSFLRVSAQAFDAGLEAEAKRLATSIRVLVHDTRMSTSLIGQLGLKETMRFEDTTIRREVLPPGMTSWPAGTIVLHSRVTITQIKLGPDGGTKFAAPLDDVAPEREGRRSGSHSGGSP